MPKGVKNGPQHQRLISRVEAAAMLGCSAQTISNWVMMRFKRRIRS